MCKPTQGQRRGGYNQFTYVTDGALQRVAQNDEKNGAELLNAALGTSWDLTADSNGMYGSMFSENCKADITAVNDALGGSMPWECNSARGNGLRNGVLSNCTQESVDMLNAFVDEKQSYIDFYIAASVLVGLIVCFGLFCWVDKLGVSETILVLIVGVRSFDMFSDWAFFAISLRKGGAFALAYAAQGGDPDVIWIVSLSFCILGSLLWLPDLYGFAKRVDPDADNKDRNQAAGVTACVFLFEDLPQLVLNAAIYLPTMGIENADTIAIFALCMSGLSLMLNCMLFWGAVGCKCPCKGARPDDASAV